LSSYRRKGLKKTTLKSGYTFYDVGDCQECGAHDWEGYQRCLLCYAYYTHARCKKCGNLRLTECARDRGDLEYYESRWKSPVKDVGTRST
jgi:hypothetical protein